MTSTGTAHPPVAQASLAGRPAAHQRWLITNWVCFIQFGPLLFEKTAGSGWKAAIGVVSSPSTNSGTSAPVRAGNSANRLQFDVQINVVLWIENLPGTVRVAVLDEQPEDQWPVPTRIRS